MRRFVPPVPNRTASVRFLLALAIAIGLALTSISAQIPGRNVNMVSGTTFPEGDPFLQRQNEPSIAASTRNPLHLLGGSNDYRTVDIPGLCTIDPETGKCIEPETGDAWLGLFKSTDGGQRWKSTLLPGYPQDQSPAGLASPLKSYQAGADSVVRAGTHGLVYYSGLVFDRGEDGKSAVFLSRFIDNNNQEAGDPFAYLGTSLVIASSGTPFLDKPWMAVDIPRGNAAICSIDAAGAAATAQDGKKARPGKAKDKKPAPTPVGQQIPAGAIYVTYTQFTGEGPTLRAEVMLKRSTDCGVTWSPAIRVSNPQDHVNQGTSIAIDPKTGTVFVAYRRFDPDLTDNNDLDAMMVAKLPVGAGRFDPPGRAHKFAKLPKNTKRDLDRLFEHRGKEAEDEFERPDADPQEVSDQVDQFDLGTSGFNFRTNAYPTMAADGTGRIYIAWTQRGFTADTDGDDGARLVITTTRDGRSFAPLRPIEDHNQPGRGHQLMPSMTFAGGKLMIVFYDIRETQALAAGGGVHDRTVSDANKLIRHTIDIRSAMALPADMPDFTDSVQVSEYQMGFNPRSGKIEELQANPPNLPMFQKGTVPFMGDYIDVAAAPAFIPGANGKWTYNTEVSGVPPVFHAAWTDNRDVRPPTTRDPVTGKLDWTKYTPAKMSPDQPQRPSIFMPGGVVPECTVNNNNAGSRNQNVYSARITGTGLVAGSPGNTKPLSPVLQRAFVVFAQNTEDVTRSFRMTILDQPPGGRASFEQFPLPPFTSTSPAPRIAIEMIVPARSTASRTVYITSSDPNARVDIRISELVDLTKLPPSAYPTAGELGGGAEAIVMLNPDIENPDIENPDIENPDIENPDIENAEVYTPDIENPDIENPDIENPDIENPDIENPDIENPDIENPDIENVRVSNPDIENPDIENPDIENPDIENPDIENPDIENPDIENGAIADVTWTVTNTGNTTAAFNVNLFLAQQQLPSSIATQLILLKTYRTPVTVPNGCQLAFQVRNVLVTNIANPTLIPPNGQPSEPNDPEIRNATLWLAPGEEGRIVLRVFDNDTSDNVLVAKKDENGNPILDKNGNPKMVSIDRAVVPSEDVTPVVQQQSVNSDDAEAGITEPPLVPAFPSPQATDDEVSTTYQTPVTLNVLANDSNAFGSIKIHSVHPAGLGQNMGGGAAQIVYLPATGLLYAGNGRGAGVIDPQTDRVVGRIAGPANWVGAGYAQANTRTNVVYFRSGGNTALNSSLHALDARPGSPTYHQFLPLPALAGSVQTLTIDEIAQRVYVFHGNPGPANTQTFVTAIDANPANATFHQVVPGYPVTMPAGIRANAAAINSHTRRLWIATTGSVPATGTYYIDGAAAVPAAVKVGSTGAGYSIAVNSNLNLVFTATFGPALPPNPFFQNELRIDVINGVSGTLLFPIAPAPALIARTGGNEKRMAVHRPSGKVYLRTQDEMVVIDGNRGSPTFGSVTVVPVGHEESVAPVVVDEVRGFVATLNSSTLYTDFIDVATNAVHQVAGSRAGQDIAFDSGAGRVFRSTGFSVEELGVSAYNVVAPQGHVAVFPEVTEVMVNPLTNHAYVGTTVLDATMNLSSGAGFAGPIADLPHTGGRYSFGARYAATNTFFVGNSESDVAGQHGRPGSLLEISGATDAATATYPSINNPFGMGINQDTGQIYVAGFASTTDGQIGVHEIASLGAGVVHANTSAIVRQIINGNPQRINYGRYVVVNHATNRVYFAVQNGTNTALAYAEPTAPGVPPVVLPIDLTPHLPADFTPGNTRVQVLLTHAGLNRIYLGIADTSQDPDLYRVIVLDGNTHNLLWSYQGGSHSNQHTASWLALNESTNRLYVVDFNADKVTLLNAVTGAVVTERTLPNGPAATAINTANGHLYVSNELDKSISALDGATLDLLSTVKLPLVAFFMEVDEVEGRIYTSGGNTGDESGTMVITDVLGNLGIDVSVTNVTSAAYGTAVINPDFSITYTPNPGLSCPLTGCIDTFTYTVTNQGGSAEGTVSVHIVAPNPVPVAVNDLYVVTQDQQLVVGALGLLTNDIGVDGPAQITLFSPGGLDSLSINADGSFTYDPAPGVTGLKTFGYSITVGGVTSNTASLTFDVRAPVTFVVTNTNDAGAGSLRQALQLANTEGGVVSPTITFNIPGAGPHRIQLASASPIISVPMIIDGYTQPGAAPNTLATGSNAIIMIELRGTGTGGFNPGMNLVGAPTTVRGLAIGNFSAGFNLDQFPGTTLGHHVEGNFIGVSAAGAAMPNNNGIEVRTQNHVIGGATLAARNVISGNLNAGIRLTAQTNGATEVFNHGGGTTVFNNLIGTAPSGVTALGNANGGVSVSVPNVTIGGPSAALGNVISGNGSHGISSFANSFDPDGANGPTPPVMVTAPTNLVVQGNRIGVSVTGTALANAFAGIFVNGTSTIGGTAGVSPLSCTGACNVISGNAQHGLIVAAHSDSLTGTVLSSGEGTYIAGNYIGLDASGTAAVPNGPAAPAFSSGIGAGVRVDIGGPTALERNVISGNNAAGINLYTLTRGAGIVVTSAAGTVIKNNYIGLGPDGTTAFGNGNNGIGLSVPDVTIGGLATERNVIGSNNGPGINTFASIFDPDGGGPLPSVPLTPPVVASSVKVLGNFIGTTAAGDIARPNNNGVNLNSPDAIVQSNLISGNTGNGLNIGNHADFTTGAIYSSASNARVQGNKIGVNLAGTAALANTSDGITISAPNVTIGGDITPGVPGRNIIAGNGSTGISLFVNVTNANAPFAVGPGGTVIKGNYIGLNASGAAGLPNGAAGIVSSAPNVTIGGGLDEGNVIVSGNGGSGVLLIRHLSPQGAVITAGGASAVRGNIIGLNANQSQRMNGGTGIDVNSAGNTITQNVIAGNGVAPAFVSGIFIGLDGNNNVVRGNVIGTNPSGQSGLGNAGAGIHIDGGSGNVIGGSQPGERNILSGNGQHGVALSAQAGRVTNNNLVIGNFMGANHDGATALPNGAYGVRLFSNPGGTVSGNVIGGVPGEGNLLSGNGLSGVNLGGAGTANNQILGNRIGTINSGAGPLPNRNGVFIGDDTNDNTIGSNLIAFNTEIGVITPRNAIRNRIVDNSIHSNGQLGIDLNGDGPTANDPGDGDSGGNNQQNFPVLSNATNSAGANTRVDVNLTSFANGIYSLQFFANTACDPSGFGEGQRLIATHTGHAAPATSQLFMNETVADGEFITALATDAQGNTSEFSACVQVGGGSSLLVANTSDSGAGSLRNAITVANTAGGAQTIAFNIPGPGPHVIQLATPLPVLRVPMTIDGYSQPGSSPNTLPTGTNAVINVELRGPGTGGFFVGLNAAFAPATIKGLAIGGFTAGIQLTESTTNSSIQGNFIGTNAQGTVAIPNGDGIQVRSPNNVIGGPGLADRNLISGNTNNGIRVTDILFDVVVARATGTVVVNNLIGTTKDGLAAMPNREGVAVSVPNVTIGGTSALERNVISGNTEAGVVSFANRSGLVVTSEPSQLVVQGNYIGVGADGIAVVPNRRGVNIHGTSVIGGTAGVSPAACTGACNVISGNLVTGMVINSIFDAATGAIFGSGAGTQVIGNYIGLNPAGTAAVPNGSGIFVAVPDVIIGGPTALERNIISGNNGTGINLSTQTRGAGIPVTMASGAIIRNNYIGLGPDGTTAYGNSNSGISISVPDVTIGGLATERNVIGSNNGPGISTFASMFDSDGGGPLPQVPLTPPVMPNGLTVSANFIGTTAAGDVARPNQSGINANGQSLIRGNLISGNAGNGINISSVFNSVTGDLYSSGANSVVEANLIGVTLAGTQALANGAGGISVTAPNARIGGDSPGVSGRNTIAGNNGHGIWLGFNSTTANGPVGIGGTGAVIKGNYIGVDATGNALLANNGSGIFSGVPGVTIGGPSAADANLIVAPVNQSAINLGRSETGPVILSTGGNSTVQGNILGLSASGARLNARGNPIGVNSSGNQILGNVIAGNGTGAFPTSVAIGVFANVTAAQPNTADNNVIKGNFIGTNAAGALGLHNFGGGISVGNASGTVIGGTTAADRNVIVGGNDIGVFLSAGVSGTTSGTQIKGNYIGVMPDGVTPQDPANRVTNGVQLFTTGSGIVTLTTLGGTTAADRNIVAGNSQTGITLFGAGVTGNTISGNYVGVTAAGTARGNSAGGIIISEAVNNTIGVGTPEGGNLIAHNGSIGVAVTTPGGTGNRIQSNAIYDHAGLGIDLRGDGVTANDPGDGDGGPNLLQNFPVLLAATNTPGPTTRVTADLASFAPGNYTFQFFASDTCDPSGFGEGERFISSTSTGAFAGVMEFTLPQLIQTGDFITATATDAAGNTSEFSACAEVGGGAQIVVTTANDSGPGSLRQSITQANTAEGTQTITFNIPGATPATPAVITVSSPLPNIVESVIIDATTQPGWDGRPIVGVRSPSSTTGWVGFFLDSSNITIRGLSISNFGQGILAFQNHSGHLIEHNYVGTDRNNTILGNGLGVQWRANASVLNQNVISGNSGDGIVMLLGATANTLANNKIGMGWDGITVVRNTGNGVVMFDGPTNNVINSNLISGNMLWGVDLQHSGLLAQVSGTVFRANRIGLDANGDDAGNNSGGIRVQNAPNTVIGEPGHPQNVISGNGGPLPFNIGPGIHVVDTMSPMPVIRNNLIGLDPTGLVARPNINKGIVLDGPARIGGTTSGEVNYISGHTDPGGGAGIIANLGAAGTLITRNVIGLNVNDDVVGNGYSGVTVRTAGAVQIGDTVPGSFNVISGNGSYGVSVIKIVGTDPEPSNTLIVGSRFGGGVINPLTGRGNGLAGIRIEGTNHRIGGITVEGSNPGNFIANNGAEGGIRVVGAASTVHIRQNTFRNNSGPSIDLGGDGVTLNDAGDGDSGPNALLNYPEITSATTAPGDTTVGIDTDSLAPGTYTIDFYSAPACHPSGHGDGRQWLARRTVIGGNGAQQFSLGFSISSGQFMTATTTDEAGSWPITSEFSPCKQVTDVVAQTVFFGAGSFGASPPMSLPRRSQAAVRLDNGKVLLAGSDDFDTSADLFDPAGGITPTGPLGEGRCYGCAAVKLYNGEVLVAAGYVSSTAERYVPGLGVFQPVSGTLSAARLGPSATLLDDGKVLIAGGHNGFSPIGNAERYDPGTDTFVGPVISMSTSRLAPATKLANGKVLFTGGMTSGGYTNTAELFDPVTLNFSPTSGNMSFGRHAHQQTLLRDGRVLVTGGLLNGNVQTASTEIYDPAVGLFNTAASMNTPRTGHSATLLRNGYVLVTGGETTGGAVVRTAEVFNPATGLWVTVPGLATARANHSATELQDGRVLIAGGSDQGGSRLATTELYNVTAILDAQAIADGSPLTARQLFGWSSVPGSFVYSPSAGTVLGLGSHNLTTTFTPDDLATYTIVQANSTLNVVPPPVITSVIPSSPKPGQMITITGTNLNAASLNDVIFTQASDVTAQYVFSNSTTKIVARTSTSLEPGASNLRVQNSDATIVSAAFGVMLSPTPGAPVVQGVFLGSCGAYGFGGTPENPTSITTVLSGNPIVAAAHGIDTSHTTFVFTPLFGGASVNQPADTACGGPIGQVAASTAVPAFAPGTVVKVELTTTVGGVTSPVSNAFVMTIEDSPAFGPYAGDGGPTAFGPTQCGPGYAMTSMSGIYNTVAGRVASIQGFCAPLKYPMDHTGSISIGGVSAGGGTQPFDAVCDPSTVAVGLFGSTSGPDAQNGEIVSLGVQCKSPSALAGPVTFTDGPYGGSPVAPFSITCPAGTKMAGFQANYGAMINKIQLVCR